MDHDCSVQTITSPLKWQTRVVACFPSSNGFAVGSVEGRVAIQYIEEKVGKPSKSGFDLVNWTNCVGRELELLVQVPPT